MTGAAQTSSTRNICRRPRLVRSSCAVGIVCTVRCSGSVAGTGTPGSDELEPDIKEDDEGAEPEPLEGIALVLLHVDGGLGPFACEPVGGPFELLQRERPQREARFGGERGQVEILPDAALAGAAELVQPAGRRG